MKLGEKIKQLRNDAGLTQPELAVKAQIEQSYLSKLENDKGSPSFDVIAKIARAFELDVMTLIDSLDVSYLRDNMSHLPEIAVKLEERKMKEKAKFKRGYIVAASLIVIGIALIILGSSNSIFPETVYQYKSMGLIDKGELNDHYQPHPIREIAESRDQHIKRIADNIPRISERSTLTRSYRGEGFVESYGKDRRYFDLQDERHLESPWRDICTILGFIALVSGGFGMGYTFKLM